MANAIYSDIQSLQPSSPYVELWSLDTTLYNGPIYYFVVASLESTAIVWNSITYQPFDIQATGFDYTSQSGVPTPKISFSTTNSVITSLINSSNDLLGCKITRIRTFRRFMDGQASANVNETLRTDVYVINTKTAETRYQVDFELTTYMDQRGMQLPLGTVNVYCRAIYRKPLGTNTGTPSVDFATSPCDLACPYAGTVYYDVNNNVVSSATQDICNFQVSGCKARFGANNEIPIMAFPGSAAPTLGQS